MYTVDTTNASAALLLAVGSDRQVKPRPPGDS